MKHNICKYTFRKRIFKIQKYVLEKKFQNSKMCSENANPKYFQKKSLVFFPHPPSIYGYFRYFI